MQQRLQKFLSASRVSFIPLPLAISALTIFLSGAVPAQAQDVMVAPNSVATTGTTPNFFAQPETVRPTSPNLNRKATITHLLTEAPKPGKLDAAQLPPLSPNRRVAGLATPLIAVGPTTPEEDADLDTAIIAYQNLSSNNLAYPDSHKPLIDFMQKHLMSAWNTSIDTNLTFASNHKK